MRSLILHNCGTATESQTRPGLRQACGEATEGEARASVNIHSRLKTLCAFLTHHPRSVPVSSSFKSWITEQAETQRKVLMLEESWIVNMLIHCLIFCWEFNHLSEFTKDELKGQNDC